MTDKIPEESIELTEEQIVAARTKLWEMIASRYNHVNEKTEPDITSECYVCSKDPELMKLLVNGQDQEAQQRLDQIRKGEVPAIKAYYTTFAIAQFEDGSEKEITFLDLYNLMKTGLDKNTPDAEAAGKLKILLKGMLEYANTIPEFLDNPVSARTLELLKNLYEYLQQETTAEELDKFFKEQTAFMAIPRPKGIEDFLSISAGNNDKEITLKQFADTKITFEGRLAIDEQKINEMIRLAFASNNPYKATKGLNTLIELPFTDTMEILGRTQTERNRKEFSRQLRKEMLPAIAHQHIDFKDSSGNFIHIEVGGGYFAVNVRKDRIYFKISDPYAAYLNTGAFSHYSSKTLRLGSQRKPLPFYLAIKLQDQYFHDGNKKRGTNNILHIPTLLNFCADIIPRYEDVQKTDPGHWIRLIRQPLEAALNEIQDAELFSWQYCKSGLAEATPQEIRTNDYRKWSKLYITYKLIPDEPDQTERLANKQARIEERKAKLEAERDKMTVEAAKIRRKRAKKAAET